MHALVGDVCDVDRCGALEGFTHHLGEARARGVIELARAGLGHGDQFLHILDWQIDIHAQPERAVGDKGHAGKVLGRVVGQFAIQMRIEAERAQRGEKQGVAIGRRLGYRL